MRIETYAKEFLEALDKALALTEKRCTLPVLECVRVTAGNDMVYMTAMNAKHETKTLQIALKAHAEGYDTFLIGNDQYKLIKKMGNNPLVIEVEDAETPVVTCKCGKRKYDFKMDYSTKSFPFENAYTEEMPHAAMMHSQDLLDAMNRLVATASGDQPQEMMRFFHMDFAKQRMETIDVHRIGMRDLTDIKIVNPTAECFIDTESLKALRKVIGKDDCMTWILVDDKCVRIQGDGWVYTQRNPDGKWFDIDKMLVASYNAEMDVEVSNVKEAVDYILSMKTESDRIPMVMQITDNGLKFERTAGTCRVSDVLEVSNYYGSFERTGFNPAYIKDVCNTLDAEIMHMEWISPKAPMMMSGDMFKVLVLPININAAA